MHNIVVALLGVMSLFQTNDRGSVTLAQVDSMPIIVTKFVERYRSFLDNTGVRDNIAVRQNILNNMINEILILNDGWKKGLHLTPEYQKEVARIKNRRLLGSYFDALADTITISENDLRKAFYRLNTKVHARHLYAQTEKEAWEYIRRLNNGETFEKIASEIFLDSKLKRNGGDLGYFSGGEMDPAFEEAAFTLPIGAISPPVKTEDGYSVIKVEDRITKPIVVESEYLAKKKKLELQVKGAKRIEFGKSYAQQVANEMQIEFHQRTIDALFRHWDVLEATAIHNLGSIEARLKNVRAFGKLINEPIVSFRGGKWTVREWLQRFQLASPRQRTRVRSTDDVKVMTSGFIVREELLRRAKEFGIPEQDNYRKWVGSDTLVAFLQLWTKVTVAQKIPLDNKTNTITDAKLQRKLVAETKKHYNQNKSQYVFQEERNVSEIAVDSASLAVSLLARTHKGEDFAKLAKQYSVRSWAAERGGELGYGTRSSYGVLGDTLFSAKVGSILGPFRIGDTYSIFKVVGIKKERQKTFKEAKEQIEKEILLEWKNDAVKQSLDSLRRKSKIAINMHLLETITIN